MKNKTNKQFTTVKKLTNKVKHLEKRCEEIELILLQMLHREQHPEIYSSNTSLV